MCIFFHVASPNQRIKRNPVSTRHSDSVPPRNNTELAKVGLGCLEDAVHTGYADVKAIRHHFLRQTFRNQCQHFWCLGLCRRLAALVLTRSLCLGYAFLLLLQHDGPFELSYCTQHREHELASRGGGIKAKVQDLECYAF